MITGVAFVPQAPALVPEIGRGLEVELGPVRSACRAAIRRIAAPGRPIVIISADDGLAGYGTAVDVATVGEWLVRDALGPQAQATRIAATPHLPDVALPDGDCALVVVGDGSNARTEKAPGHLHPEAGPFDALVADALRSGEGDRMHLYPDADDLEVAGVAAWTTFSYVLEGHVWDAELLFDDAPFGVGYFVAVWTARAEH